MITREEREALLAEETARVVAIAMERGADTAVASMQEKSEFEVEVRNGEIENLVEADYHSVSLTLSKNGRRATVSSCDLSEASIREQVEHALDMCRYTDEDPFYTLPEREQLCTEEEDLDLYDPQVSELVVSEKIGRALELERLALGQDPRLQSDGASLSTVAGTSVLANSLGFCRARRTSIIGLSTSMFAEDQVGEGDLNTGRKQTSGWSTRSRYVSDLESAESIAQLAAQRVLRKLGGRRPPSGKVPVYFEPSIARGLWSELMAAISGTNIYRHESYLEGFLGKSVASPLITIVDDPSLKRGLGSRVFDAEGLSSRTQTLVAEGQLETYLMGCYSAKKLGLQPTGHSGGTSNLLIQPGNLSEEEMIRSMDKGIWLTSALGQGVNLSTGGYSRGGFGLWVENGKVQYPVMEFTLNSNLQDMFHNIVLLGNNVQRNSSIQTPGFVISEMTVSST